LRCSRVRGGIRPQLPAAQLPEAAALLAAGIGSLVLGILTTIAEASASFADALALNDRVGPLSGKTIYAVAAWVVAWIILGIALRRKDPSPGGMFTLTAILVLLGFLGTLPTFFEKFAPE
ncbi:MAG TPA: hypothetical protein VEO00_12335, partial [Actinomycetota bacterium]|nr:hypothetical protein [Actinomycetota bacterium]